MITSNRAPLEEEFAMLDPFALEINSSSVCVDENRDFVKRAR